MYGGTFILLALYRVQCPSTSLFSSESAGKGAPYPVSFSFVCFFPRNFICQKIESRGPVFTGGEDNLFPGGMKRLGAASALGCSQASWSEWDSPKLLRLLTWARWASWGGPFWKLLISVKRGWSRRPKPDAPVHRKANPVFFLWWPVLCVWSWISWIREWD